ncbi:MAG: glycosyltransferase family 39 protein [Anaerolineae bacterium]|nr:glycosyltransferase family 39 protein [Anaerolineae bacterium]
MDLRRFDHISRRKILTAVVWVVILGFHIFTLMRFPQPFVDEAWVANRAWWFLKTGRAFGTVDTDFMVAYLGYWTYFPLLPALVQVFSLWVAGAPSLFAVRIVSLFFGLILLAAVYAIANRVGGRRYALLSIAFVAFSWPFCISAHWARYDIMAAAIGFVAIALYFNNPHRSVWISMLSGFCIGIAFEFHPHAAIYAPAVGVLYLWESRWKVFRRCDFWSFIGGGLLGGLVYVALHVLPYPQTYAAFNRIFFFDTHIPPIFTLDPQILLLSFYDLGVDLLELSPGVILAPWAIVTWLRNGDQEYLSLSVLGVGLLVSMGLLVRNKELYYAILLTPALDLIVVAFILREWQQERQQEWHGHLMEYVRRVLIWGVTLSTLLSVFVVVPQADYRPDYRQAQMGINEVIQPGDTIMGAQVYWFGLTKHDYDSWEELVYYRRYVPGSTLEEALEAFQPDILIWDGQLDQYVSDHPGADGYSRYLILPRQEFQDFLAQKAKLLTRFDGRCYGQIEVYRIVWP